jgi:hypothetical protein
MAVPNPNLIVLSHATYVGASGATAAATYAFFTKDYKPAAQARYIDSDTVKNANGKFKYIYDNGPGFREWSPFSVVCEEELATYGIGTAAQQYAKLTEMWEHPGLLKMKAPDGTFDVIWSPGNREQNFRIFPHNNGDTLEYEVVVQFEEGQ